MEFHGVIKKVLPMKSGVSKSNGKEWTSQDFVIEEVGQRYNQSIVFNVFGQDRINQFDLAEGMMVTVSLDFQTNEWQDKFYNRVTCYNVVPEGAVPQQVHPQAQQASQIFPPQVDNQGNPKPAPAPQQQSGDSSDLPF